MVHANYRALVALSLPLSFTLLITSGCGSDTPPPSTNQDESGEESGEGGETSSDLAPTWHQDIAPVVHEKCSGCHRAGGIAPFSVDSYETASMWGPLMLAAVEAGTMPPWGAEETEICTPPHAFKDDPRLSVEEEALFADWVAADMPEGDPEDAAALPELPSTSLDDGDLNLVIPSSVDIEGTSDRMVCFVVDPEVGALNFIDATQINPGNDKVVHHVLVYSSDSPELDALAGDDGMYECFGGIGVPNLSLVSAWAPGVQPAVFPEEAPGVIQSGEKLVMQVHYHPTGGGVETDDSTSIDIRWHEGLPEYVSQLRLFGNATSFSQGLRPGPNDTNDQVEFRIPAGEEAHTEEMHFTMPNDFGDMRLWMVGTHMHYVGTDMAIGLVRQEESEYENACLLQTPRWDFNWQRGYVYDVPFDEAPIVNPGDQMRLLCEYNNTLQNPFVAEALAEQGLDEPQDVFVGEETLDEMCIGIFGLAVPLANVLP